MQKLLAQQHEKQQISANRRIKDIKRALRVYSKCFLLELAVKVTFMELDLIIL